MNFIDFILIILFWSFSWKVLEIYYSLPKCQLYAGKDYAGQYYAGQYYAGQYYAREENLSCPDLDETYMLLC